MMNPLHPQPLSSVLLALAALCWKCQRDRLRLMFFPCLHHWSHVSLFRRHLRSPSQGLCQGHGWNRELLPDQETEQGDKPPEV